MSDSGLRRQEALLYGQELAGWWHSCCFRAFGDKLLKPYVVAEPEIQEEDIEGVEFLIIASDGLWNVVSNKDAVAVIQGISDAEASARKLVEEANARGSTDNITCIVVRFDDHMNHHNSAS